MKTYKILWEDFDFNQLDTDQDDAIDQIREVSRAYPYLQDPNILNNYILQKYSVQLPKNKKNIGYLDDICTIGYCSKTGSKFLNDQTFGKIFSRGTNYFFYPENTNTTYGDENLKPFNLIQPDIELQNALAMMTKYWQDRYGFYLNFGNIKINITSDGILLYFNKHNRFDTYHAWRAGVEENIEQYPEIICFNPLKLPEIYKDIVNNTDNIHNAGQIAKDLRQQTKFLKIIEKHFFRPCFKIYNPTWQTTDPQIFSENGLTYIALYDQCQDKDGNDVLAVPTISSSIQKSPFFWQCLGLLHLNYRLDKIQIKEFESEKYTYHIGYTQLTGVGTDTLWKFYYAIDNDDLQGQYVKECFNDLNINLNNIKSTSRLMGIGGQWPSVEKKISPNDKHFTVYACLVLTEKGQKLYNEINKQFNEFGRIKFPDKLKV